MIADAINNTKKLIKDLKRLGSMVVTHDTVVSLERQIKRLESVVAQPKDYEVKS